MQQQVKRKWFLPQGNQERIKGHGKGGKKHEKVQGHKQRSSEKIEGQNLGALDVYTGSCLCGKPNSKGHEQKEMEEEVKPRGQQEAVALLFLFSPLVFRSGGHSGDECIYVQSSEGKLPRKPRTSLHHHPCVSSDQIAPHIISLCHEAGGDGQTCRGNKMGKGCKNGRGNAFWGMYGMGV